MKAGAMAMSVPLEAMCELTSCLLPHASWLPAFPPHCPLRSPCCRSTLATSLPSPRGRTQWQTTPRPVLK